MIGEACKIEHVVSCLQPLECRVERVTCDLRWHRVSCSLVTQYSFSVEDKGSELKIETTQKHSKRGRGASARGIVTDSSKGFRPHLSARTRPSHP